MLKIENGVVTVSSEFQTTRVSLEQAQNDSEQLINLIKLVYAAGKCEGILNSSCELKSIVQEAL